MGCSTHDIRRTSVMVRCLQTLGHIRHPIGQLIIWQEPIEKGQHLLKVTREG